MAGTTEAKAVLSAERRDRLMEPVSHPIRSSDEYEYAVARLNLLLTLNAVEGSPEDDLIDLLSVLVEDYDREHETWSHERQSPQSLVKFMAEQKGLSQAALAELMGGRSRLSEFFNEKRSLSRSQILSLRDALGIPADLLIA
jgi:HTH-type transcriptional regulator/antitoxin HigA